MNRQRKKNLYIMTICVVLSLIFLLSMFYFVPNKNARADEPSPPTTIQTVWDKYFSLELHTTPRADETVEITQKEVVDTLQKTRTYWVLNWSEVEVLQFVINLTSADDGVIFNNFSLGVTHVETDDLTTPLSPQLDKDSQDVLPTTTSLITNKNIVANSVGNYNFYYHVDSTASVEKTESTSPGQNFGLYRFTLTYNYTRTSSVGQQEQETEKYLEMYIAIMPTPITEDLVFKIRQENVQILHRVSSSNGLMNKYTLWLSNTEIFKYINPRYIKWKVVGKDGKNNQYVLDKKQRAEGGEKTIYDSSPTPPYGSSFEFDSNGIEGMWNVSCDIEDKDGNVLYSVEVRNLTTFRTEPKSNLWWILLILALSILLIIAIILIIVFVRKKKNTVW